MKIVIAPDSYKGSLTAREVAIQIEQGFLHVFPKANFILAPMGRWRRRNLRLLYRK